MYLLICFKKNNKYIHHKIKDKLIILILIQSKLQQKNNKIFLKRYTFTKLLQYFNIFN